MKSIHNGFPLNGFNVNQYHLLKHQKKIEISDKSTTFPVSLIQLLYSWMAHFLPLDDPSSSLKAFATSILQQHLYFGLALQYVTLRKSLHVGIGAWKRCVPHNLGMQRGCHHAESITISTKGMAS